MQEQLTPIIAGLIDLQTKLTGNQAACEQIVALKNQMRDIQKEEIENREVILEDYRNDVLAQASRIKELIDDAPGSMSDFHLFGISGAAQMLTAATKNYFDLRNMIAAERLAHPQFILEV
ncbi:MAG: hypothetical protein OEV64_05990 [Desulfobulbaceae bacterium]|nr:hypothetical protein [Desulfobulbaceae bacterium]